MSEVGKFTIVWPVNDDLTSEEVESFRAAALDEWGHVLRKAGGRPVEDCAPVATVIHAAFRQYAEDGTPLPMRAWKVEGDAYRDSA